MTITVYTKPSCVQCNATYRALDARGLRYEVIDLTNDASALERVAALGYRQAPVVVVEEGGEVVAHWSGFDPDRLKNIGIPNLVA